MSPPLDRIRVFLLEDDQDLAQGLMAALSAQARFEVVNWANSIKEACVYLAETQSFDLALIDLGLPDGSGLSVIEAISATRPESQVLAFTQFDDAKHVFSALRAGAVGYLLKSTGAKALVAALDEALAGGSPLSPRIARYLVSEFSQASSVSPLTSREQQVLQELAHDKTYGEVALTLRVEVSTVQTHVKAIYKKLQVSSRQEARQKAQSLGLLPVGS